MANLTRVAAQVASHACGAMAAAAVRVRESHSGMICTSYVLRSGGELAGAQVSRSMRQRRY